MSRARRRFEERKRKLKRINAIYRDWSRVKWDGKYLYRDWSHYWWFDQREKPIKWWRQENVSNMSEAGHHKSWLRPMMTRPWRINCKRVQRDITSGRIDPDEALFPIYGRPWIYYW
jgi:hypothetical protein